ncbi:hypothetical protein [Flavobacterium laiguense]|uniref:Uncharacterized protein n=1 Tax=Flavobacterium laiguense TaxID=2169409 RepID=A0A2U1K171_9FLAO|nr:hypothetical protein [Flavobacterium laiguense]PWA10944.1 hypothetical protein DB891_03695 [Flavobacterium laiguense]
MSIEIIPIIDHESYKVNGHMMYKDHNENWISSSAMTDIELRMFRRYKKLVIDNPAFKKHTKATYKG